MAHVKVGNAIIYQPETIVLTEVYKADEKWHLRVDMGQKGCNGCFATEEEARAKQAEIDKVINAHTKSD